MVRIGYLRISSVDADSDSQREALESNGAAQVFLDHASTLSQDRPGWAQAMESLAEGDELVVARIGHIGRSLSDVVDVLGELLRRNIRLVSLEDGVNIDADSTPLFDALGEYHRAIIRARVRGGSDGNREELRKVERYGKLSDEQVSRARQYLAQGEAVTTVARILGTPRMSIYKAMSSDS